MEAELNSPMCRLRPGEECEFKTEWFPTRTEGDLRGVTDAGILIRPLRGATLDSDKVRLTGTFGVFYAGHLVADFYNEHGAKIAAPEVAQVTPAELVNLQAEVPAGGKAARVSLHLVDESGLDRGSLGEVRVLVRDDR